VLRGEIETLRSQLAEAMVERGRTELAAVSVLDAAAARIERLVAD
jgi:hypothetical protein